MKRWVSRVWYAVLLMVLLFAGLVIAGFANFWVLYFFLLLWAWASGR